MTKPKQIRVVHTINQSHGPNAPTRIALFYCSMARFDSNNESNSCDVAFLKLDEPFDLDDYI